MSNSTVLSPVISIGTAYQVSQNPAPISLRYSQAQQPFCSQTGVNQSATPEPSPSR
jgi:hypothetical protein